MSRTTIPTIKVNKGSDYRNIDRLSYSQLSYFYKNRIKYWKKYVLKEDIEDEESNYLLMGNLVDTLITEPENFDKKYIVTNATLPTPQMTQFCKFLLNNSSKFETFSDNLVKSYDELKEWNGGKLGTGFEKYVENFTKEGQEYYKELLASVGKKVISIEQATIAEEIHKKIKNCKAFLPQGEEVLHKVVVLFDLEYFDFEGNIQIEPMKCELDLIDICNKTKKIYPKDLKIVSFVEDFFTQSFLKNNYYIQQALYSFALYTWKKDTKYEDYEIMPFQFLVADQLNQLEPLLFVCDTDYMEKGFSGFTWNNKYYKGIYDLMKEMSYNLKENKWGKSLFNKNNIVYLPKL